MTPDGRHATDQAESQGRRPRALVVDDDQQVLGIVRRWLTDAAYDVVTATNYRDARRHLEADRPDVLIVDVRLEEFNGMQLVLGARAILPAIRIVVISGFSDPVLEHEAAAQNAPYLSKPLTSEQLLAAIAPARP